MGAGLLTPRSDQTSPSTLSQPLPHSPLPHHAAFSAEASAFLRDVGQTPIYGDVFIIRPRDPGYQSICSFLLDSLERLPFENQVGETILMRGDAREVVRGLTLFLNSNLQALASGEAWAPNTTSIANFFTTGHLEVFKNEIYSRHKIDGIGYSLDLGTSGSSQIPSLIRLIRYAVTQEPTLAVREDGSLALDITTGTITLDLCGVEANIHRG